MYVYLLISKSKSLSLSLSLFNQLHIMEYSYVGPLICGLINVNIVLYNSNTLLALSLPSISNTEKCYYIQIMNIQINVIKNNQNTQTLYCYYNLATIYIILVLSHQYYYREVYKTF